jgi:hypothetical protein
MDYSQYQQRRNLHRLHAAAAVFRMRCGMAMRSIACRCADPGSYQAL